MHTSTVIPDNQTAADRVVVIVRQLMRETHPTQDWEITLHTSFERDLGLDSLAKVELMLRVGTAFGVALPAEALAQADTPQDVLRFLGQTLPQTVAIVQTPLGAAPVAGLPEAAQSLLEVLEWHVARQTDRPHILLLEEQGRERSIRYRDLLDAAKAIAAGLAGRGLQPRQTVALMLPTGHDYLASFFGIMLAGGIPVPIYPPARLSQIEEHLRRHTRILANAQAALIITVPQAAQVAVMLRAAVPTLAAAVTPDTLANAPQTGYHRPLGNDVAFLQYTSGSTGDPKGVVLTHANLLANIRALGRAARVTPDDVFVSWLPLYHDMGLIGAWFGSLYHGIPLVLMSPLAFLARPAAWLETVSAYRGTISAAPNFAYELCIRHIDQDLLARLDLSRWRLAFNGAEPVSPTTLKAFAAKFAACGLRRQALTPVYGLAESSVGLAFPPLDRGPRIERIRREPFMRERTAIPAQEADTEALQVPSCGRPLPGHEIRIVDEAGYELPERRIGRLEFRGPSSTSGYFRNPQATAKLFRGGWLDSGDDAYMADGEVFITGRVKDVIIRGGRHLYPYDLEQAVGNLPSIRKGCVAVFASSDPAAGTERLVVMAETRERDTAAKEALRQQINTATLDIVGAPADDIVLVPPHSVLKTSSGKIRRIACREAYERGEIGAPAAPQSWQLIRLAVKAGQARAAIVVRRLRTWAYGVYALFVFAAIAVPSGAAIALLGRPPAGRRLARRAARWLLRLMRLPLAATGIDRLPAVPHVLLVNHASYLDSILLTALLPAVPGYAYVAKRELARIPLLHTLLRGLGTVFVERFDARRSLEDVTLMTAALHRGENLLIFPEGTFTRQAGLKPFREGAFVAAANARVPIVVTALRGARSLLREGTWLPHYGAIEFAVGPTLSATGSDWASVAQLSASARDTMLSLTGEFALPEHDA
ncbi:MAG TPA: AMP-binding protein [Burkholderiaceae bacterium]|nr:AMP-binding protein [Burkholderiaceae bacterium]